jgi:hypothetical protein
LVEGDAPFGGPGKIQRYTRVLFNATATFRQILIDRLSSVVIRRMFEYAENKLPVSLRSVQSDVQVNEIDRFVHGQAVQVKREHVVEFCEVDASGGRSEMFRDITTSHHPCCFWMGNGSAAIIRELDFAVSWILNENDDLTYGQSRKELEETLIMRPRKDRTSNTACKKCNSLIEPIFHCT